MTNKEIEKALEQIQINGRKAIENLMLFSKIDDLNEEWAHFWINKTEKLISNTNDRLISLSQNRMLIYDDTVEVGPFWQSIMKTVKCSIKTTNLVKPFTFGNSLNGDLLLMQKEAIDNRSVVIERLFIYPVDDKGKESPEQVAKLKSFMATQLAYGIQVYAIKNNIFKSNSKADGLEVGSDDFMIIDDQFVYETHYEETEGYYRNFMQYDLKDLKIKQQIWQAVKEAATEIDFDNINDFNKKI